ncbi:hypothetical protein ACS0TY_003126 [Phlomoides rotata]
MGYLSLCAYKGGTTVLIKWYRLGWTMGDEQDLIDCLENLLLGREITSYDCYMKLLVDLYYELEDKGHERRGIHNMRIKVESLAHLYAQFKLFVFKMPGVKYNFLTNKSMCFGQEEYVHAMCRMGNFEYYHQCYNIFDVKGVEMHSSVVIQENYTLIMNVFGSNNDVVYLLLEEIIPQTIMFICMIIHHMEESRGSKRNMGCLGALDGTFINVLISAEDRGRYRTRKGQIATNVLAVCDIELKFVYVLPGWEGSASDTRILHDSVNRSYRLKVPVGFMALYRGVMYHLKEWGPAATQPATYQEYFNMHHMKVRNVIERAFIIMKMRWGILRSASFYPMQTQIRLIMTYFLLHNFIKNDIEVDPMEMLLYDATPPIDEEPEDGGDDIGTIEATTEWTANRDLLAQ